MMYPTLREEKKLWQKGYKKVACIDEAGRGPLAGPVTAAAVVIEDWKATPWVVRLGASRKIENFKNLKDSKKLSSRKREHFYKLITKDPHLKWGIGIVSEKIIDKINIKNATELAMEKAVKGLKIKPDFLIIDGNHVKNHKLKKIDHRLIIKADEKVFSCAVASIIAKVTRDRIMVRYHKKYPRYKFDLHKGYPTKLHIKMLKKYGPCKIHRRSFSPVMKAQNVKRKA